MKKREKVTKVGPQDEKEGRKVTKVGLENKKKGKSNKSGSRK